MVYRAALNDVCLVIECLKGIELQFIRKDHCIVEQQVHIGRLLGASLLNILNTVRNKISASMRGRIEAGKVNTLRVCIRR